MKLPNSAFSRWFFFFLVWSTWDHQKKTFQMTFPFLLSPGLLVCKPFKDFGFLFCWEGEEFGSLDGQRRGKLLRLALTPYGVVPRVHAHQRGEALQWVTSFTLWSPSRALACGSHCSSLWLRSHLLEALPRAFLYAQQNLFTCAFLSGSGFVPMLWWASSFQGLLGFWVSHELRAPIALIVFTPAYFLCGCHYSCVMFLLSLLSWLSFPWQAQSDSLIHIC